VYLSRGKYTSLGCVNRLTCTVPFQQGTDIDIGIGIDIGIAIAIDVGLLAVPRSSTILLPSMLRQRVSLCVPCTLLLAGTAQRSSWAPS
jgi:hypothetical protein